MSRLNCAKCTNIHARYRTTRRIHKKVMSVASVARSEEVIVEKHSSIVMVPIGVH